MIYQKRTPKLYKHYWRGPIDTIHSFLSYISIRTHQGFLSGGPSKNYSDLLLFNFIVEMVTCVSNVEIIFFFQKMQRA